MDFSTKGFLSILKIVMKYGMPEILEEWTLLKVWPPEAASLSGGVYGNIDGPEIRNSYPEKLVWRCEEVTVYMTHIGGYPGRYAPGVKNELIRTGAKLFICGHSHILKVIYDDKINCLHMNPGAAGNSGWHTVRTIMRFAVDGKEIKNCEVIELGKRGTL